MSPILEQLNRKFEGKYDYIRVNRLDINKEKGTAELVLIYPYEKEGEFGEADREAILKWLQFMLPDKLDYDIVFKKSYVDEEVALRKVKEYFRTNLRTIYVQLKDSDIKVKLDDNIEVYINIGPMFYDFLVEQEKIETTLKNYLEHSFTKDANIHVSRKEEDTEFVFDSGDNKVFEFQRREIRVKEKEQGIIVGKGISQNAMYIADIKNPMQEVVICGKIEQFSRRIATKTKNIFYTFILDDTTGKIHCKYFTKNQIKGPLDGMQDGMEVVIGGKADDDTFIKGISVNIRRMSYAKIDYSNISVDRATNILYDHYLTVEPEKYVDMMQQDFFTMNENPIVEYLVGKTYVVFDFETTGLDEKKDRPIEIGALKIKDGVKVETFSTLVNPEKPIPEDVQGITHIDDDMVKGAPTWREVVADFYKFTKDTILVGHNVNYDCNILINNSKDLGYKFDNERIDTCKLAQKYIRGQANNKLITLCNFLGISLEGAHRALNDVLATAGLFEYIAKNYLAKEG